MYNNTLQSEADYEMPMDQNDFNLKIQGNVANGNAFLKRIEKQIQLKGVSNCGQFRNMAQAHLAFSKLITTGQY